MGVTLEQMLSRLNDSYPALMQLATGGAFVIGMAMIFKAVFEMKQYGEARAMMSSNTDLRKPITSILVGAVLIYLPSALDTSLSTLFGSGSVMSYSQSQPQWQTISTSFINFMRLLGVVAFIRGWLILSRAINQPGSQQTTGKGLTHIIGGILAINIVATRDILLSTFGIQY